MTDPHPESLPGAGRVARVVAAVGALMIVVGAIGAIGGCRRVRAANEITEVPVTLRAGEQVNATITTAGIAPMVVQLAVNRGAGVSDLVIDSALFNDTNPVNIVWRVERDGVNLFSGNSTNARGFSGSVAMKTKTLGAFRPPRRGTYRFRADVLSNQPDLEPARPTIRIVPNSAFRRDAGIAGSVSVFAGGIFGLVGLILVLLARRRSSRRN